MDMRAIASLTDAQKDRYSKLEKLFATDGWKLFTEFAEAEHERYKNMIIAATTWEANREAFGAAYAFNQITEFENGMTEHFEQMAKDNLAAAFEFESTSDDEDFE